MSQERHSSRYFRVCDLLHLLPLLFFPPLPPGIRCTPQEVESPGQVPTCEKKNKSTFKHILVLF